jgi:hypothetical protein
MSRAEQAEQERERTIAIEDGDAKSREAISQLAT